MRALLFAAVLGLAACSRAPSGFDDPRADPGDAARVALGERVYAQNCASCHGAKLEGQPNWQSRRANGRLPAPPHDDSGHTWHHADSLNFKVTKNGVVPPYAPQGYESDMPAFGGRLSDDEIWAVLAFIKSRWTSREVREARAQMAAAAARR